MAHVVVGYDEGYAGDGGGDAPVALPLTAYVGHTAIGVERVGHDGRAAAQRAVAEEYGTRVIDFSIWLVLAALAAIGPSDGDGGSPRPTWYETLATPVQVWGA